MVNFSETKNPNLSHQQIAFALHCCNCSVCDWASCVQRLCKNTRTPLFLSLKPHSFLWNELPSFQNVHRIHPNQLDKWQMGDVHTPVFNKNKTKKWEDAKFAHAIAKQLWKAKTHLWNYCTQKSFLSILRACSSNTHCTPCQLRHLQQFAFFRIAVSCHFFYAQFFLALALLFMTCAQYVKLVLNIFR